MGIIPAQPENTTTKNINPIIWQIGFGGPNSRNPH
jgi:hypothetical protein